MSVDEVLERDMARCEDGVEPDGGQREQGAREGAVHEGDRREEAAQEKAAQEETTREEAARGGAAQGEAARGDVAPGAHAGGQALDARELGRRGEAAAAHYLVRNGYEILERNWACKFGEADIIARDEDGTVCFIEVKTRRSYDSGFPEEAVTPAKQRRYEKIALSYMMELEWDDCTGVRFDAIAICVKATNRAMLRHHRGCFNGHF